MSELVRDIREICGTYGNDPTRLMDVARAVQSKYGCVCSEAIDIIARAVQIPRVEVESLVSFYAFLSVKPKGKVVIRLCNDIIDEMFGAEKVGRAFAEELGIQFGETTPDGKLSLEHTPCIGMSDQAPAALIDDVVVSYLSSDRAREIVRLLRETGDPRRLVRRLGDGNNAHPLVRSMVHNNIRREGPVVLAPLLPGQALRNALAMSPVEVINDIKTSRLRGRGGAGFPTGMKWEFTRAANGNDKCVVCNADEGEPGTFKDRVILTEHPDLVFEGMAIAGYAIGAELGIVYLRAEYAYLRAFLESVLQAAEKQRHQYEPGQIKMAQQRQLGFVDVDQEPYRDSDGDTGRKVDQKQPMPGKRIGQVTADRRTQGRRQVQDQRDHHHDRRQLRHAEFRIDDGKHQGHHGAAAEPLHCAINDHLAEACGRGAQCARPGKAECCGHEQHAGRQQSRQGAGQWHHDDVGNQIGGLHPGDLVDAGRQSPLDLGQRAGHDLDVHDRHEQPHDHGENAEPVAQAGGCSKT